MKTVVLEPGSIMNQKQFLSIVMIINSLKWFPLTKNYVKMKPVQSELLLVMLMTENDNIAKLINVMI